ncbi:MAG: coproporphyrinogen dehydrogenase HemZ [Oscillospiraceae bacterium]|nr:coproporphyrinogen dehydrogenase HemZ [Oscillospiraceae bacterium]
MLRLTLRGLSRKSAAEQAALNYFPPDAEGEVSSYLGAGREWLAASARITLADGRTGRGTARRKVSRGGTVKDRDECVRRSIYRAALPLLPEPPPWGSLTGIRPAGLAAGLSETQAGAARILERKYHVEPERARLAAECAGAAREERARLGPRDIALYAGIPFCPSRCAYCSFVSSDASRARRLIGPFVGRLLEEIALAGHAAAELGLRPVTLYIGGGTPTVLEPDDLRRVLEALEAAFGTERCTEITVEAGRPDTVTAEKLAVLRARGVTRVSVNPQSMRDGVLEAIGRGHTAAQTRGAFALARAAGFRTLNADLIAGLPGDTPEGFAASLEETLAFGPENLTVHTLALKKGAAVWKSGGGSRPDAGAVRRMLDGAYARLRGAGYRPYYLYRQKFMAGGFENTGWTLPGHENRYNLHMMEELATVLAVGSGVSKIVRPTGDPDAPRRIGRIANCKFPLEYLEKRDKIDKNLHQFKALWEGMTTSG